ncbi:MAG: T9SS type A sorting domain-containing protein [Bacteroidales bacterium]|nr:T9SS type A sorting domain-containing protein [Bacteroidales bacterium]
MEKYFLLLFVFLILQTGLAQNHVCNESFETARDGSLPADWRVQFSNVSPSWGDWLERVYDPTNVETYDGEYGLKISPNGIEQPNGSKNNRIQNWVISGNGFPSCGPGGALSTSTHYMISFMAKAENLTTTGSGGLLMWNNPYWEGANGNYYYMGIPTGTYDWRQITSTVTTSANLGELGGGLYFEMRSLNAGTLWLDKVEFFEVVPSEIRLSASPSQILPTGSSTITAKIYDNAGHFINIATNDITFTIRGSGSFAQGDSPLTLPAVAGQRQVTFLPSGVGQVTITATSTGLTQASVTITVNDLGQAGVPEINIPYGEDVETDYWKYHPYNENSPDYNPLILSQSAEGTPYTIYDVDNDYSGNLSNAVSAAMAAFDVDPDEKAKILLTAGNTYYVPDEAIKISQTSHLHFVCVGGIATIKAPATFTGFSTSNGMAKNMIHIQAHAGDPMVDNYEANGLTQTWKYLAPTKNFYFNNILFDMNGVADKAVEFIITKDVVFDNCEFINYLAYASHAVCFSDNIWFRSCRFTSTTGQMAVLFDGTHGCGFLDCDVDFNTDYGFNFYTNNDCTVDADLDCELDANELRMTKYLVVANNRFGLYGGSMNEVVSVSGSQILILNNELGGSANVFVQQKSGCNFNTGRRVHAPFYFTDFRVIGNTVNSGVTLNDFYRITNHANDNCEPADPGSPCTNPTDYSGYTGNYEVRGNVINGGVLNPTRDYHSFPYPPFVTHQEFTGLNANAILTPNFVCGNCYQNALCEADESGLNCIAPESDYSAFGCYQSAGAIYYLDAENGNDSYSDEQAQSPGTPWQSFEHAIYSMSPASTLIIRGGVYVCGGSEMEIGGDSGELGGTSAAAATVIKAETGERVIITGPDVGGGVHEANPIRLRGDYIRLEGIWFGGAWGEGNEFNLGSNSILDIAEGREIIGCTFFGYNSIRDGYYTDLFMHKNRFVRMGVCLDPPAIFMAGRAGSEQYKTKAVFDKNIWIDGKGQAMVGWHSARNIMFTRNIVVDVWGGVEFDDIYGEAQGSGPGGDHFVANNLFWNSGQTVSDPCTGTTVSYNAITHNASNMHSINNIMAQGSRIGVSAMIDDLENSSVNKNAIYNTSTYSGDNSVSINNVSEFSTLGSTELSTLFTNISNVFSQTPDQILSDQTVGSYFELLENSITTQGSTLLENAGQSWISGVSQTDIGPDTEAPGGCADDFWAEFYEISGVDGYSGFRKWNTQGNILLTKPAFVFGDGSGSNRNYRGTCNNCWDLDFKVIISPENATSVSLEFLEFDLEENGDYLKIYDGSDPSANLLAAYTGNSLPDAVVSNTGTMVLHFETDGDNTTGDGWKVSYTSSTDVSWLGATSGDWSLQSNWANGHAPGANSGVIVPATGVNHFPLITSPVEEPAECSNLIIEDGATVTVAAGRALTVHNSITNPGGAAGLILVSDASGTGSLIHHNSEVTASIQRYITAWTSNIHGWHFLSAPVSSQNIQPGFVPDPPTASQDFYKWDELTATWINSKLENSGNTIWNPDFETQFVPGRGYLAAWDNDQTKLFAQYLNVEDVEHTNLSKSGGNYSGWHLLGNPFSSAIIWNDGNWDMTNIGGTAKIWNESNASYTDIPANGIIPAMNGFMVQVTQSTGSLTIPATNRTHDDQSWYKNSGYPKIKLLVKDLEQNTAQESTILFHPQVTEGFDPKFDSRFLAGYAPQFFSVSGGEKLSVNAFQSFDENLEIPFHFIKNESGSFELQLLENTTGEGIYVEDLKTGTQANLSETSTFSFSSFAGDNVNRFVLSFLSASNPDLPFVDDKIIVIGKVLTISGCEENFKVLVYNTTGQMIFQDSATTGNYTKTLSIKQGIYLVKLEGDKCNTSKKVMIW